MKVDEAIEEVRAAEVDLAKRLRTVGERHTVEHDLYHLGHTLAAKCFERLETLEPIAERYGTTATAGDREDAASPGIVEALRHKTSELLGRTPATGMMLLTDLRDNYLAAQRAELGWTVLVQAAKAVRDLDLLQVATGCGEEAQTTAKWLRTKIKVASPQILAMK